MEQYISKSALVAEIKRLIDRNEYSEVYDYAFRDGNNAVCVHILNFINNLEVKEVDLDLEITLWVNAIPEMRLDDVGRLAKYFFELGLKTKKGE